MKAATLGHWPKPLEHLAPATAFAMLAFLSGCSTPPDKVILLPDGIEDTWSDDLADLIALA